MLSFDRLPVLQTFGHRSRKKTGLVGHSEAVGEVDRDRLWQQLQQETLVSTAFLIESLRSFADHIFEIVAITIEQGHNVVGDVCASIKTGLEAIT